MSYKIFGDSCLDLTEELKKDPRFEMIPLTLQVDDHMIMDDETFDQKAFLAMVKASRTVRKLPVLPRRHLRRPVSVMRTISILLPCPAI